MVTAKVIEIRESTDVTPQGRAQQVLSPEFQLPMFSGTFTAQAIPRDEYTRDKAEAAVLSLADQLVDEETEVTVQFPSE